MVKLNAQHEGDYYQSQNILYLYNLLIGNQLRIIQISNFILKNE